MSESYFQSKFIKKVRRTLPECIILKNNPNYLQGVPDWIFLNGNKWATLEIKDEADSPLQPNQDYYVDLMDRMSFSAFIFPENEREVFRDLQQALQPRRSARFS